MLFARISRSNPERAFIVAKNGYGTAALTNGQPVMWDLGDADGVNVTMPSAAFKRGSAFAGIVAETIAVSGYGLIQVYGYHSAVIVDSSTTADIYTGAPLFMSVAAFNLEGPYIASGGTAGVHLDDRQVACALEAYTLVGTTGTIKAQIFAM
jgi:hypothetical protein